MAQGEPDAAMVADCAQLAFEFVKGLGIRHVHIGLVTNYSPANTMSSHYSALMFSTVSRIADLKPLPFSLPYLITGAIKSRGLLCSVSAILMDSNDPLFASLASQVAVDGKGNSRYRQTELSFLQIPNSEFL